MITSKEICKAMDKNQKCKIEGIKQHKQHNISFKLNNINLVFLGLNTKLFSLDRAYILFAVFVNIVIL